MDWEYKVSDPLYRQIALLALTHQNDEGVRPILGRPDALFSSVKDALPCNSLIQSGRTSSLPASSYRRRRRFDARRLTKPSDIVARPKMLKMPSAHAPRVGIGGTSLSDAAILVFTRQV